MRDFLLSGPPTHLRNLAGDSTTTLARIEAWPKPQSSVQISWMPGSTIWVPGWASSARMIIAISPPMKKKMKVVQMYWIPITLWSVLTLK